MGYHIPLEGELFLAAGSHQSPLLKRRGEEALQGLNACGFIGCRTPPWFRIELSFVQQCIISIFGGVLVLSAR